jgi:toxin ParE1/3/4
MVHQVAWSRRALHDFESVAEFIASDSPTYASIVVTKVRHQTRMLAQFPRAGRKVPEFDDENVREVIVSSYWIIYRLQQDDEIVSAAVIHGKRLLQ